MSKYFTQDAWDKLQRVAHLDAAESAFVDRQLEFMYTQTYDIKFASLKANQLVPMSTQAGPGSVNVTYKQFDEAGLAKVVGHAAEDMPRVDVSVLEFTRPVRMVSAKYGWTLKEVAAAAQGGTPLQSRRAGALRRSIERKLDEIAALGEPEHGIASGALNEGNVTIDPSAGAWTTPATADTIIGEIGAMLEGILNDSLGVEEPNTLVLPPQEWALIATTPRAATADTTILEYVRRSFPGLQRIEHWSRLDTAGAGGVRRAWMYDLNPDILTHEMPRAFELLPVQEEGLMFWVHGVAETAGTAVYYPVAMRYLDGI